MTKWQRKILACIVMLAVVGTVLPSGVVRTAFAGPVGPGAVQLAAGAVREPQAAGMIIDGLVVRPLGLVATVIGSAVFVVTLPFSALGGNVEQARQKLIDAPAGFTFSRCLGCFGGDR